LRKKIFVDTNILLSGVFFSGNEAKILSLMDIDLYTSDYVIKEAKEVIRRKFETFGVESCKVALEELEHAVMDFEEIIQEKSYAHNLEMARSLINKPKDVPILAAVLSIKPDYFITGDNHFFTPEVKKIINVCKTRRVLEELGLK